MAFRNKRGNVILESVLIIIILLVFTIISLFTYQFFDDVNQEIQGMNDIDSEAKEEFNHLYTRFPSSMDGIFAVCFGILWIMVLVTSFMIDSHPVFFVISLFLLICLLFASGMLANAYEDIKDDQQIAAYAADFPISTFILTHLMHVVFVIGLSIAIVLYGKNKMAG